MIFSKIKKKVMELETRPVLLHEMPGRVRFGIKVLKRLTKEMLPLADHLKAIIQEIPAVFEIKINNVSGSLLIKYDTKKTDSQKVQTFMREVIRYLLGYAEEIMAVKDDDLPEVLQRLSRQIKEQTTAELVFTPAKLPKDVWTV